MSDKLPPGMAEAVRLTGAGKLAEATSLIQRLLRGGGEPEPPRPATPPTLDGDFVTLDPAAASSAQPSTKPFSHSDNRLRTKPVSRTGLGETLRGLAARLVPAGLEAGLGNGLPNGLGGMPRPAAAPLPDGASFATLSHSGAAGTRAYKLYVPANRPAGRRPLVVMMHGCTQSPDDFAAGTGMNALAEEHGILVAYPEQPASANAQKCWNWFKPEDQRRDQGEPALIAGITRQIMRDHPVDPDRVWIAGLSAGGAAAAIMGAAYPDLYAAVGVHSGLPAGAARDLPSAFAAMRQGVDGRVVEGQAAEGGARAVPTIIFHGDQDNTVHPRNGDAVATQATAAANGVRSTVQPGRTPDGHAHSRAIHADASGRVWCEQWTIHGAGHAWAGGSPAGSYTDPRGPDATREMLRFFLDQRLTTRPG